MYLIRSADFSPTRFLLAFFQDQENFASNYFKTRQSVSADSQPYKLQSRYIGSPKKRHD